MSECTDVLEKEKIPAQRFADLILDIGTYLLASGAHCGRLNSNLGRLASRWEFGLNINPTFNGLLVMVKDLNDPSNFVTSFKNSPAHNVHLAVLTEVSHLSWKAWEKKLSIMEVEKEFAVIKAKPNYKSIYVAIAVGFSCAGLCLFSSGDAINAIVAFVAAFIGYLVRAGFAAKKFNLMIGISIAAFVSTFISGLGWLYGIGSHAEAAMATAVLYLIPGVPLINSVIDLIEGYLSSAINRVLFGGFILLCIATGMSLCITLMGVSNF